MDELRTAPGQLLGVAQDRSVASNREAQASTIAWTDLLDLVAGEGPLGVAEAEPEVEALAILGDVAPPEGVEIDDRLERRAARPTDDARQFGPGEGPRDDQREVASHGRERRQRVMAGDQIRPSHQDAERQLGRRARTSEVQRVEPGPIDLADPAQRGPRRAGARPSAGREPGGSARPRLPGRPRGGTGRGPPRRSPSARGSRGR